MNCEVEEVEEKKAAEHWQSVWKLMDRSDGWEDNGVI